MDAVSTVQQCAVQVLLYLEAFIAAVLGTAAAAFVSTGNIPDPTTGAGQHAIFVAVFAAAVFRIASWAKVTSKVTSTNLTTNSGQ